MKRVFSTLIISLLTAAWASAFDITGTIVDETSEPMAKATVRALSPKDSTAVKGAISDFDGQFKITGLKKGKYVIEATYVGFLPLHKDINLEGNLDLGTLVMREDAEVLKDITVTGIKTPIKVMEDTIEYNADSYKTQPNAVVEDLLKRLPGVDVSQEGKITANGKEVTKILVDGKEFFSDDPKVASKNIPVDMIDKLQVVDRKSDLARLTGVDDGEEETVINLTVKKGMQNGWFGTIEAGYGTDDRYKGWFNINRFWDGNQITFIGGANNVNDMGFTDGGMGFRRFGGNQGITTSRAFGINFNVGKEEIFRVGGDVMYTNTDRNSWNKSTTQYLLENSTQVSNNERNSTDKGHNVRADFRIEWKPDSFNTLDIRPNLTLNYNKSLQENVSNVASGLDLNSLNLTNQSLNAQKAKGSSYNFGTRLIYNHNFKEHRGRSFSINGDFRTTDMRENENAFSWIKYYIPVINDSIYDQYTDNHTWNNNVSARISWTEPLGDASKGNFITFAYRFQYRWNDADKLTYNRPIAAVEELLKKFEDADLRNSGVAEQLMRAVYGLPIWSYSIHTDDELLANLSNRFRNDYMNQDIRLGYKHVSKTHNLDVGISVVPQMSRSIDLINDAKSIPERWVWNVAPYMRYRLKMSKSRSLNIDYRGRSSQPSMAQLQPVADMSDPLNIVQGNPNLAPSFTHNMSFRFQDFNMEAQRSIMVMANVSTTQNSIISKTTLNSNGSRYTTYENVNGVWNAFGMNMISFPLKNKAFTINNFINVNYMHSVGFNNEKRNNAGNFGFGESLGIAYRPDMMEIELRPNYRLQYSTNSLSSLKNSTIHSYGGSLFVTWYAPFGLVISSNLNYSANTGYGEGYNKNEWMWNASLSYMTLRDKSLTFTLSGNDLLNQRSNINRSVTGNYIQDSMYNSLTRYLMLSVSYKFNTFGKGNLPKDRNNPFGDFTPPPGAPRGRAGHQGPPPGGGGRRPF